MANVILVRLLLRQTLYSDLIRSQHVQLQLLTEHTLMSYFCQLKQFRLLC